MWSLGKVIQTPEVMRVYIGSFWNQRSPVESENKALMEAEQADLLNDLYDLPRNAAIRKINEMVKRAKLAKVHALVVGHLRAQMPSMWGHKAKQSRLIENLVHEFTKVQQQHRIPPGDFPDLQLFQERLRSVDLTTIPKLGSRLIRELDDVLIREMPKLMLQFPQLPAHMLFAPVAPNPFEERPAKQFLSPLTDDEGSRRAFHSLHPSEQGHLSGTQCKPLFEQSALDERTLADIWDAADRDGDGALGEDEFCAAMRMIRAKVAEKQAVGGTKSAGWQNAAIHKLYY